MSALPTLPHNADQAYIDRVIASNNGWAFSQFRDVLRETMSKMKFG